MLKRLASMGIVDYNSYKGVRLTEDGKKIALEILRHHRLLELYLKEMLGFSLEKVHDEACRLEHHISEEFVEKIDEILGNPEYDPHGHPIPGKNGALPETLEEPLNEVDPGEELTIRRVSDYDPEMLQYFEKMELVPGIDIKLIEKAPFNGPLTILHKNEEQIIGNEIAKNIFVEPTQP
jgi:DtxR family Mn-dependent transcriptional regulator